MTEEQLAAILADHLDAWLAGKPLPEELPPELAELLPVAQNLTQVAPEPRPEFGPALKQSLVGPSISGNGAAGPISGYIPLIIVAGLLTLGTMVTFLGTAAVIGLSHLEASPTPPAVELPSNLSQPVQNLTSPTPATPQPTVTNPATVAPDPEWPEATATVVLDILPPITATLETTEELVLPPPLAPGSPGSGDDGDSGGDERGGQGGDHNRGHGNDPDHHDEDNPGRSK